MLCVLTHIQNPYHSTTKLTLADVQKFISMKVLIQSNRFITCNPKNMITNNNYKIQTLKTIRKPPINPKWKENEI